MKFQILMSPKNALGAYFAGLTENELKELTDLGFHFVCEFEADNDEDALEYFVSWCKRNGKTNQVVKMDLRDVASKF